jgi:hypothetical protein
MLRHFAGKLVGWPVGLRRSILLSFFGTVLIVALGQQPASTVREIAPGVYFRQGDRDRRQPANTVGSSFAITWS